MSESINLFGELQKDEPGVIAIAVAKRVIAIIAEHMGLKPEEITRESTRDDLGTDSLDEMEIVMEVEDEFEFVVPDLTAQEFKTVGELIDYVAKVSEVAK